MKIYLFEQAQPIVKGSLMLNIFTFVGLILGLYQIVFTIITSYEKSDFSDILVALALHFTLNSVPQIFQAIALYSTEYEFY